MFPIVLDLAQARVALVGNGEPALRRLALLDADAARHVVVYADDPLPDLASAAGARLRRRLPGAGDLAAVRPRCRRWRVPSARSSMSRTGPSSAASTRQRCCAAAIFSSPFRPMGRALALPSASSASLPGCSGRNGRGGSTISPPCAKAGARPAPAVPSWRAGPTSGSTAITGWTGKRIPSFPPRRDSARRRTLVFLGAAVRLPR